jgi:hypothetical protein
MEGGQVESAAVQEMGFPVDGLRVEELEPRLEFMGGGGGCLFIGDECVFCLTPDGDLDFVCDGSDS